MLSRIRALGRKAGVVLDPASPPELIEYVLELCDIILVMTVDPGFGGQAFLPAMVPKIRRIRAMCADRGLDPIIEVDETAGTANCRSYYTVIQQTDDFGPQIIVTGRYHDQFQRVDGRWRYSFRDYSLMDMVGDVSHHLTGPLAQARGTA